MLKGLALTPPIVGRISIGKVIDRDGRRLPEKDDEFTITTQVQTRDGWLLHPLNDSLRQVPPEGSATSNRAAKLRSIPVRLLFDDPELNMRASYTLFDRKSGRPLCVGNGETCRRSTGTGMQSLPCPTPDGCEFADRQCRPLGRLNVRIDGGEEPGDELGSFIFRTAGFNSVRTLATRLRYFAAVAGGCLSTLPLELRLRGKSTTQSHRAPIYYVDLTLRSGMRLAEGIHQARTEWEARRSSGVDQSALDQAARDGAALSAFEESSEDAGAIIEEFYPEEEADDDTRQVGQPRRGKQDLAAKLAGRLDTSPVPAANQLCAGGRRSE
jgi:hypothetical protein